MVQRLKQGTAIRAFAYAVKSHRIQALEYVEVFAMTRRASMLLREALDLFKTSNDTLITGRTSGFLLNWCKLPQLCRDIVIFSFTHNAPPP